MLGGKIPQMSNDPAATPSQAIPLPDSRAGRASGGQRLVAAILGAAILLASPAGAQQFQNVTVAAGLDNPFDVQGVAFADHDGDGDLDMYLTLVLSAVLGVGNQLYRNDGIDVGTGEVSFTDVAIASGASDDQTSFGACFADLDNDGDADLLTGNGAFDFSFLASALHLFRNNGTGLFSEESAASGLGAPGSGRSIVAADFDNDGDVDFFLATPNAIIFGERYYLFRNDGVDGTSGFLVFTDVTSTLGLSTASKNTDAAAWADYDNDGDQDLYVVNHGLNPLNEANELYKNQLTETGIATFVELAGALGVTADEGTNTSSNGAAWGDCDNDGDLDLYVASGFDIFQIFGINAPNRLYINGGDGTFAEAAAAGGVVNERQLSFSAAWGDFDNDGLLDLYVTNSQLSSDPVDKVYKNSGNCTFTEWSGAGASDAGSGQGTALGDYDRDGDLDVFVANIFSSGDQTAHLYKNLNESVNPSNNWIVVDTVGVISNRDGIGARITIICGASRYTRQVYAGSGYLSEDSLDAEFGIGANTSIDRAEILWPSGCLQVIPNPPMNAYLRVVEDCMPGFDTINATESPCDLGIALDWEAAAFASGTGHYEVRRGSTCADAAAQPELTPRPFDNTYLDLSTAGGLSYAFLVRAIDDVNGDAAELCAGPLVDVDGRFTPIITAVPAQPCPNDLVLLSAVGPPGSTYSWDMDADGSADFTTPNGSHTWTNPGLQLPAVTITSPEGCIVTQAVPVDVRGDQAPLIDETSLRVRRQGPSDPWLTWTVLSGSGSFDIRRNYDRFEWASGPSFIPLLVTVPTPERIDTMTPLVPGQCAYYQVLGNGCQ